MRILFIDSDDIEKATHADVDYADIIIGISGKVLKDRYDNADEVLDELMAVL